MAFRKYHVPTRFPAAITFRRDGLEFDFRVASPEAFEAFKMNVGSLDGTALKTLDKERGEAGVDENDLKSVLTDGAEWREKRQLEADGPEEVCARDGKKFQPVLIPWKNNTTGEEGVGGNFRSAKAEEIEKYPAAVQTLATDLTDRLFREDQKERGLPETGIPDGLTTRALAMCESCRKFELEASREAAQEDPENKKKLVRIRPSFYKPRGEMVAALLGRDAIINEAISRRERREAFDTVTGIRRTGDRGRDYRGGGPSDRPRPELAEWNGARFHKQTVDALGQAVSDGRLENSLQALMGLSIAQLVSLGIASDESKAAGVLRAATRGAEYLERRTRTEAAAGTSGVEIGVQVRHKAEQREHGGDNRRPRGKKNRRSDRYAEAE